MGLYSRSGDSKRSASLLSPSRRVVLWLLIVVIANLLITPQVDFPDAVMGSSITSISSVGRVNVSSAPALNVLPLFISRALESMSPNIVHVSPTPSEANPHFSLTQICILRC
jgi:hypothetical protein